MQVGDMVKRLNGRRTHWIGIIVKDESRLGISTRGRKTFLVQWFDQGVMPMSWEQDFSLEVISKCK